MFGKIKIVALIGKKYHKRWEELAKIWEKWFKFELIIDTTNKLDTYLGETVDILFTSNPEKIENKHYEIFKKRNPTFSYVVFREMPTEKDADLYKGLVDRVIYTGVSDEYLKWSTIASLRRYKETHSKASVIFYKNIIADFAENKFLINNKKIRLTTKEVDLLRFVLKNKGKYISKNKIFKEVWGYDEIDTTRTVDQMVFKLKKKIGPDYFDIKRQKGIKFE